MFQRSYHCLCGRAVFFRNSQCLSCGTALGYEPHLGKVVPLAPDSEPGLWRLASPDDEYAIAYRRCVNLHTAAACNWLVPADLTRAIPQPYCLSCRLTRTVPDLSIPENARLWQLLEDAKSRVISALAALGLPLASRAGEDSERGLLFDFLRSPAGGPRVLTGHRDGLITLNIEEADGVHRERMRTSMHEPYRTLVGHFRHEVGHYYWGLLVAGSPRLEAFRALFGDEGVDYDAALQKYYRQGPPQEWPQRYVSAYASTHPWEDWAETWAHYLHMVDALGTAMSFGIRADAIAMPFDCFLPEALYDPERPGAAQFLALVNSWLKLTSVLNELCRSMGQPDFYPFALPGMAVRKLHFVHLVICDASPQAARVTGELMEA